jgi:hypothetical protein
VADEDAVPHPNDLTDSPLTVFEPPLLLHTDKLIFLGVCEVATVLAANTLRKQKSILSKPQYAVKSAIYQVPRKIYRVGTLIAQYSAGTRLLSCY